MNPSPEVFSIPERRSLFCIGDWFLGSEQDGFGYGEPEGDLMKRQWLKFIEFAGGNSEE